MHGLTRTWQTKVLILWGPSGTGKSTLAEHLWPKAYYAQKEHGTMRSQGKLWFDGYDRHDVVIIDDYHYTLSLTQFKELVSKSGHHVPCKDSKVPFVAKLLVILSNDSPDVWWPNQTGTEHYAATRRRMCHPIGKIIHIGMPIVEFYEDSGRGRRTHRKWLPSVRHLSLDIKEFVEYDTRDNIDDNNDMVYSVHTPVPVLHGSGPSAQPANQDVVISLPASPEPPSPLG